VVWASRKAIGLCTLRRHGKPLHESVREPGLQEHSGDRRPWTGACFNGQKQINHLVSTAGLPDRLLPYRRIDLRGTVIAPPSGGSAPLGRRFTIKQAYRLLLCAESLTLRRQRARTSEHSCIFFVSCKLTWPLRACVLPA
jgi:hypothetical protein